MYKHTWYVDCQKYYEKIILMLEAGYDVNETTTKKETLLMLVSIDPRWDDEIFNRFGMPTKLTELFIEYQADVNAVDNKGRTALMWACAYKGFDFLDGSYPTFYSDNENGFFDNIYDKKLVSIFYYEQIKALVNAGADISIVDKSGFTALDYFEQAVELNALNDDPSAVMYYSSKQYKECCEAIRELLH